MKTSAAIVRDVDGVVTNIIIADDEAPPSAPADHSLVVGGDGMAIDGAYDQAAKTFGPRPELPERPLAEIKARAAAQVDEGAEAARGRWITKGDGQSLVYGFKRAEAEAWAVAGSSRRLQDYPFMHARAARLNGVSNADVTEAQMQSVADVWSNKIAEWKDASAIIKEVRETAKEEIAAAEDAEAVQTVLDELTWPE